MGFLDDLGKSISDAGHGAIQKSREIADVAKCNSLISEEEKKIQSIYYQVGRQYVEKFWDNSSDALFAEEIEAVRASSIRIEELKVKALELKGIMICPNCNTEIPVTSIFCATCGTKVERPEPVKKFCAGCGTQIPEGNMFCVNCGMPVPEDDDEADVAEQ